MRTLSEVVGEVALRAAVQRVEEYGVAGEVDEYGGLVVRGEYELRVGFEGDGARFGTGAQKDGWCG